MGEGGGGRGGCLLPNLVQMLEQKTMRKGTFSVLGSSQRCNRSSFRVGKKYKFYRKGSVFQVVTILIVQGSQNWQ